MKPFKMRYHWKIDRVTWWNTKKTKIKIKETMSQYAKLLLKCLKVSSVFTMRSLVIVDVKMQACLLNLFQWVCSIRIGWIWDAFFFVNITIYKHGLCQKFAMNLESYIISAIFLRDCKTIFWK